MNEMCFRQLHIDFVPLNWSCPSFQDSSESGLPDFDCLPAKMLQFDI